MSMIGKLACGVVAVLLVFGCKPRASDSTVLDQGSPSAKKHPVYMTAFINPTNSDEIVEIYAHIVDPLKFTYGIRPKGQAFVNWTMAGRLPVTHAERFPAWSRLGSGALDPGLKLFVHPDHSVEILAKCDSSLQCEFKKVVWNARLVTSPDPLKTTKISGVEPLPNLGVRHCNPRTGIVCP